MKCNTAYNNLTAIFLTLGVAFLNISPPMVLPAGSGAPPSLFAEFSLASCGAALTIGALLLAALLRLRRWGIDALSCILFLVWATVSLHYIHISNNYAYTNDVGSHIYRVKFMASHWLEPYGYSGWEAHHPPAYYYIAAVGLKVCNAFGVIPRLTMLRFMSWVFYVVFSMYSLRALNLSRLPKFSYHLCAMLFLLWPAGFHLASKINSESLYYALYAIAFYHILKWYEQGKKRHLMKALLWAGASITVRTGGIIILTIVAALVIIALFRRRILLRDFFTKGWIGVGIFLLLCMVINMGKVIFYHYPLANHLGDAYALQAPYDIGRYFHVNYIYTLQHPFNDWTDNQSFWDYVIKTSLYGEYIWPSPELAKLLNFLLMTIILYALLPWVSARRSNWSHMMPYALNGIIGLMYLIHFCAIGHGGPYQDARYIYPSLMCFVIFFGKSYEMQKARGEVVLTALGPLLVACFTGLSVFYFWTNYR